MLLANNLSFKRSSKTIFHNLDIALAPHKIIQIKGRNGIGKTTLTKILSNILIPTTGNIYWNGQNIKKGSHLFFKNLTYNHFILFIWPLTPSLIKFGKII